LLTQTLPECNIEAFFQFPPEYPKTLCQKFQEQPVQPAPVVLGVPGWQSDADVFFQTNSSVLTNKTVFIQGNFTVLSNFEFNNCWVIISPGVKIIVEGGATTQPLLTIDQSRLFCCNGLWAGIDLQKNARVNTQNNSEIEDATTAVIADGEANTLNLNNTTFNRNRVGVQLGNTTSGAGTSITMVGFSNNKFTCTSPLNTTVNEITFAGILIQRTIGTTILNGFEGRTKFIKIHHGIYVGVHLQGVKLDQTFLTVLNCEFDQIIQKGIFAEPRMVLTVTAKKFINNGTHCIDVLRSSKLQVVLDSFIYDDNVIPNGKNFYYGVRFNPSGSDIFFNDQNIEGNTFYITFLNQAKIERFHGISMYGDLDGADGDITIDHNYFFMRFSHPPGLSGETRGISVIGGINPVTENSILDNYFEFKNLSSPGASSCAINVTNGDYNNLTISDNYFRPTEFDYLHNGETGIRLIGSTGTGNSLVYNVFSAASFPNGVIPYEIGIYAADFDNTNYEYNILKYCDKGFLFHGINEGTQMICNDILGGDELLKLDFAVIGAQGGPLDANGIPLSVNGNEWGHLNIGVPSFDANCTPTNFADLSQFFVNGTQSPTNSYFPVLINPTTDWFFGNGPNPSCVFASNQSPLERSIVNGELAGEINNPADAWEAERYLLNRLNSDVNLLNSWGGFQTFKNAKDGTSMAQLSAVQKMIDSAFVPSVSLAAQVAQKRVEAHSLLEQANLLDEQIITGGETNTLLIQRNQVQESLALMQSEISVLDSIYALEVNYKLQVAKTANNAISVTEIYETNTKTVNGFIIDLALESNLSEGQINILKLIAAQCPRDGGMAVYKARGVLPECELENIDETICYPLQERTKQPEITVFDAIRILPNPNKGTFLVRAQLLLGSQICVFDVLGNLITERQVTEAAPVISIEHALKPGVYFCHIRGVDGRNRSVSFVVTQ